MANTHSTHLNTCNKNLNNCMVVARPHVDSEDEFVALYLLNSREGTYQMIGSSTVYQYDGAQRVAIHCLSSKNSVYYEVYY